MLFDFLEWIFGCKEPIFNTTSFEKGYVTLSYGKHELSFDLEFQPYEIWTHVCSEGNPVCHGDITMASGEVSEFGFILHVDVKSDAANIRWLAIE